MDIDDLISSFAGSHVGQEQLDLAALQKQLMATLCQPPSNGACGFTRAPHTTPQSTPQSLGGGAVVDMGGRIRRTSVSSIGRGSERGRSRESRTRRVSVVEDEWIVEDEREVDLRLGGRWPVDAVQQQQQSAGLMMGGASPSAHFYRPSSPMRSAAFPSNAFAAKNPFAPYIDSSYPAYSSFVTTSPTSPSAPHSASIPQQAHPAFLSNTFGPTAGGPYGFGPPGAFHQPPIEIPMSASPTHS